MVSGKSEVAACDFLEFLTQVLTLFFGGFGLRNRNADRSVHCKSLTQANLNAMLIALTVYAYWKLPVICSID